MRSPRNSRHPVPAGNDLSPWADQGVLLLNTALTVEDGQPASHAKRGWETVTDALIALVARDPSPRLSCCGARTPRPSRRCCPATAAIWC